MPELGTSGSVGAAGEQSPAATRCHRGTWRRAPGACVTPQRGCHERLMLWVARLRCEAHRRIRDQWVKVAPAVDARGDDAVRAGQTDFLQVFNVASGFGVGTDDGTAIEGVKHLGGVEAYFRTTANSRSTTVQLFSSRLRPAILRGSS